MNVIGNASTSATVANTRTLAHRTGRRLGTAMNVERIMPVEYSPVITSTPSTPMASSDRCQPISAVSTDL